MKIGEKVKKQIEKKGVKVRWLAENLALSSSSLSQRLSGNIKFKHDELKNISVLLGLGDDYNWFGND